MTSRSKVDWRVPATEWEAFEDFIHEKYGEIEGYVGREVESAMREWVDMDRGSDAEKTLDRLVRAAGRRPADLEGKKPPSSDRFVDADTTRVSCYVHSDVRAGFTSVVDETDDRLGVALARALSEYRQGGRDARLEQKLERIADDAEDLLSEISDDADPEAGLPIREKRTVAICNRLGPSFTEDDLDEAIASVAGDSQATLEHYRERVIDRLGYAQHPNNPRLYIPRQEAEEIAEEWTETLGSREPRSLRNGGRSLAPPSLRSLRSGLSLAPFGRCGVRATVHPPVARTVDYRRHERPAPAGVVTGPLSVAGSGVRGLGRIT